MKYKELWKDSMFEKYKLLYTFLELILKINDRVFIS